MLIRRHCMAALHVEMKMVEKQASSKATILILIVDQGTGKWIEVAESCEFDNWESAIGYCDEYNRGDGSETDNEVAVPWPAHRPLPPGVASF